MDLHSKSHFNEAPTISKRRTRFDMSHSILTSFNTGDFVPVFCEPVYPGETHSLRTSSLTRLETSLHQTMDNAFVEFAFFFVPNRILWENFDKFLGANDDPWTQTTEYTIPQLRMTYTSNTGTVAPGSLINHLYAPSGSYGSGDSKEHLSVDALPLRGVFQCYNDWYRDENYDSIIYFSKGNGGYNLSSTFTFNGSSFTPRDSILKVNRFKDVFSTALPAPQKGQEVSLGLVGLAPLVATDSMYSVVTDASDVIRFDASTSSHFPKPALVGDESNSTLDGTLQLATNIDEASDVPSGRSVIDKTNLKANLASASSVTINQLRLAIAAQAIAERSARSGTRLKERIYGTWGVDCPDARLDRAEFLGGKRFPVNMMEVLQTSETGQTVLGSDAGHSKTTDSSESFVRSFTEYGWIIGFMYVRTSRSYSQGIDRKFRNKSIYDLYDPMLDNIGELAIEKSELYALKTTTEANCKLTKEAAGYQEAWYHLKSRLNRFSGYFQPAINGTLDSWHYGDSYSDIPTISAGWLKESASQVDRTIAVTSEAPLAFQWTANVYFEYYATRTMAKYSIPNTFGF